MHQKFQRISNVVSFTLILLLKLDWLYLPLLPTCDAAVIISHNYQQLALIMSINRQSQTLQFPTFRLD